MEAILEDDEPAKPAAEEQTETSQEGHSENKDIDDEDSSTST